jgi:hypothetical protein
MSTVSGNGAAAWEDTPSYEFCRWVTAVVLDVVQGRLIGVEQRMFPVVERILCLVPGSDEVIRIAMLPGLLVVAPSGIMVAGGDLMACHSAETYRRCDGGCRCLGGAAKVARQRTAVMGRIARACRLPLFQRAQGMAMSAQRLMCSMGIVLSDLVMARGLAVKLCCALVM